MRSLTLLFLVVVSAVYVVGQTTTAPLDSKVVLEVSLATSQPQFHIGEIIPIKLSFSSSAKDRYQVNMAQYDRSGRMNYERFEVSPADGAVDPLPHQTGSLGGLTNHQFLALKPWSIKLNLNEWVRFTRPGEYTLVVSSNRVGVRNPASPLGSSTVTARSNQITLKIVAGSPSWQKQLLSEAVAILDAPAKQQDAELAASSRRRAFEILRFLGTAEAARELARRMRGDESDGMDYVCMQGLISSPEREAVRAALAEALADPSHPIDGHFLHTLLRLNLEPGATNVNWQDEQRKATEKLITALPAKRGKALAISLSTAVNEGWNGAALPKQTTDLLVKQLVSMFDQLPLNVQNLMLSERWDRIASPAMIPILRRYVQTFTDYPEMRETNAYDSLRLSGSALRRWYELDPAGARPAFITEVTRTRPRFDSRVLGLLPDETLSEVDFALAEHLAASRDHDGGSNLASLIERYATEAILPQITEQLDRRIGRWGCSIQNPLLAYVLRVNPAMAATRIEQALAARGKSFSACNHELFQIVSELHYDPVLEEIAIRSLDDSDLEVAMSAATMLGKFGSPAAESALWRRFTSWNAKWAGRESELDLVSADRDDKRLYQLGLGQSLAQALATGRSWFFDKTRLQQLSGMTNVRQLHQQLRDNYLKVWHEPPLVISFGFNPSPWGFHGRVAQYEFQSMSDLQGKLAQFPPGTEFILYSGEESTANVQSMADLEVFLKAHGMSAVIRKR
jgi:hypothetical protein